MTHNPLLTASELPPFDTFSPDQVIPAIDELLKQGRDAVAKILSNKKHNYESVVGARNLSEDLLSKSWGMVNHLNSVSNSDELREVYNTCLPKLSAYSTEMGQNRELYQAYQSIDTSDLPEDQKKALSNSLLDFQLSGVGLEGEERTRCGQIQQKLSELSSKFSENVLDATMAWTKLITDETLLAGLPQNTKDLLAQNAKERDQKGYLITLDFPSYIGIMTYADSSELRKEVYEAFATKASEVGPQAGKFDNSTIMEEILSLKQELSKLLGFKNASEKSLARKMAKSTDEVLHFLTELAQKGRAKAEADLKEVQDFARENLAMDHVEAWDMTYVSEKLKVKTYEISQEEIRQYFPLDHVISGMFEIVKRVFGIEVQRIESAITWHKDVHFYSVLKNGTQIARFYLDPYARQHKQGGAWMDDCRSRQNCNGKLQTPVAYLVCNFPPPIGDQPALLTHDDVTTLFHEFGHGLHHMLTVVDDPNVSGINGVAWDAVELPSQMMENWCWNVDALPMISSHYQTGKSLPKDLLDRMLAAKNFQSGMQLLRQIELSLFDFRLHMEYGQKGFQGIQPLLDEIRDQVAVTKPPKFNRFQHGFSHIFAGGYSAGYYSYKWAEVLSSDAFSLFEETGVFNADTGKAFVDAFLSRGGVQDAAVMFEKFRGRGPSLEALLRHSGIQP